MNKPPITVKDYPTYFGGKSGAGTYQTLINHVPPCTTYVSGCLGNCGLTRYIKPAELMILNDLDSDLVASWKYAIGSRKCFEFYNIDVVTLIRSIIAEYYDTADVFLYLDPTYRTAVRKTQRPVYRFEMSEQKHIELLESCLSLNQTKIMISNYPDPLYDEYLRGWYTHDFWSNTHNGRALERIYMNYQLNDQLHDYSFIGEEFREREQFARIRKNLIKKINRLEPVLRNAILSDLASQNSAI